MQVEDVMQAGGKETGEVGGIGTGAGRGPRGGLAVELLSDGADEGVEFVDIAFLGVDELTHGHAQGLLLGGGEDLGATEVGGLRGGAFETGGG